jgi:BASS family bile acid:Na+ symporter
MAASVVVGLALPPLAAALRPWVVPAATLMVLVAVLRVDPARLKDAFRRPRHILAVGAVVLLGLPVLAGGLAWLLGAPSWLSTGLALAAAAPPLSSAAAFAVLVNVDAALVTAVSLPATLASPATVWAVTAVLPGVGQGVDATQLVARLAFVILGAFALAFVVRKVAGEARVARAAPALDAAMVGLVTLIGVGVMHDVGLALRAAPLEWLGIFAATWALSMLSCAAAWALFRPAGPDRAMAAGLSAAVKNMAVMVAAVLGAVDPKVSLVVITAQMPIFLSPLILKPVFARLARPRGAAA